jgi:hypothetical protein
LQPAARGAGLERQSANPPWRAEVEANGGLLLALDGIQPDKGHETIYLIRDLLTGHLLGAQNLLSREAAVIQERLLAPIAAWGLPVLGVLTDPDGWTRVTLAGGGGDLARRAAPDLPVSCAA